MIRVILAIAVLLSMSAPLTVSAGTWRNQSWGSNYGDCSLNSTYGVARGVASWYKTSNPTYSYVRARFYSGSVSGNPSRIQVRGKCYSWNSFGYGSWTAPYASSTHRACGSAGGGRQPYASSCRISVWVP